MKNFKLYISALIVMISFITSILVENNKNKEKDITTLNIEALHASAGEAWCDKSTDDPCEIQVTPPDGDTPIVGLSKGLFRFNL